MIEIDADTKLFLAFQQGDEASFEKLLKKYETQLLNYLYYNFTAEQSAAEDLLMEVFLKVYHSAKFYQPRAKFSTYLYRVATNCGIDYRKKLRLKTVSLDELNTEGRSLRDSLPDENSSDPTKVSEAEERNKIIHQALLSLPENQRLAITLRILENRSYREIAEVLGISTSAVETLLFRARQNLKERLSFLK